MDPLLVAGSLSNLYLLKAGVLILSSSMLPSDFFNKKSYRLFSLSSQPGTIYRDSHLYRSLIKLPLEEEEEAMLSSNRLPLQMLFWMFAKREEEWGF
jgi:hypothetical protein